MSKFRKGASSEEIRDTQKGSSATKHGFLFDRDDEVNSYVAQIMNGQTTLEDVPEELQTNVKSELRANGFKQTSKNEGAKMNITRSTLRRLVNEELNKLREEEETPEVKSVKAYYSTAVKTDAEIKGKKAKLAKELFDLGTTGEDAIMKALEAAGRIEGESFASELAGMQVVKESRRIRRRLHEEIENDQYETLLLLYDFTVDTSDDSNTRSDFNIVLEDVAKNLARFYLTALRDIEELFDVMIKNEPKEKTAKLEANLMLAGLTLESIPELIFNEQRAQRSFPTVTGIDESKHLRRLILRELRQQGII